MKGKGGADRPTDGHIGPDIEEYGPRSTRMNEFWNKRTRGVIEGTIEGTIEKMGDRFGLDGHLPGLRASLMRSA